MINNTLHINEVREIVEEEIINPNIVIEVQKLLKSKNKWTKVSNITEVLGHISLFVVTIVAFASGTYRQESLAFATGCISTISISLFRFSHYAAKESVDRSMLLNTILTDNNIRTIPNRDDNLNNSSNINLHNSFGSNAL